MTQDAERKSAEPFADFTKMLEQFKVPGIDMTSLIEARRNDLAALTQTNKIAYEGMRDLVRRQVEILRTTMEEAQAAAKEMVKGAPSGALTGQPKEFVGQAVQKALANMRELAEAGGQNPNRSLHHHQQACDAGRRGNENAGATQVGIRGRRFLI